MHVSALRRCHDYVWTGRACLLEYVLIPVSALLQTLASGGQVVLSAISNVVLSAGAGSAVQIQGGKLNTAAATSLDMTGLSGVSLTAAAGDITLINTVTTSNIVLMAGTNTGDVQLVPGTSGQVLQALNVLCAFETRTYSRLLLVRLRFQPMSSFLLMEPTPINTCPATAPTS